MRAARASAAAALLVFACAASAAELGTLFHSAEERARLDRMRRGDPPPGQHQQSEAPARGREITGFVVRSDGRGTAFVDGVAVPVDPRTSKLLDPKSVRQGRRPEELKIERK